MFSSNQSNVAASVVANYIEEVFSTYLYTGNSSTQTITNNIDLSTKGGLVWIKCRTTAFQHNLIDTVRGPTNRLSSNSTGASSNDGGAPSFNSNGFTVVADSAGYTNSGDTFASWTFRKQAKFFDVVTFTAGTSSNRRISHSLGSAPGMILLKANESRNWYVYHRSLGRGAGAYLNLTNAAFTSANTWGTSDPTATDFGFDEAGWATSGVTQTAYLFAHDAGGFGLAGTDNVISCGSVVSAGNPTEVTLGWEPQWLLIKNATSAQDWWILDNMRGLIVENAASSKRLHANTSAAETGLNVRPTATGFINGSMTSGETYIYIAIRRGPMKVPTTGTSVFSPFVGSDASTITTGFPVDMLFDNKRAGNSNNTVNASRLVGENALNTSSTAAETGGLTSATWFQNNTGYLPNALGTGIVAYAFQRAPSFMDVVCYTGTGVARTVTHNLAAVPELMIVKRRNDVRYWAVYASPLGATKWLELETQDPVQTDTMWNDTTPTASVFSIGTYNGVNGSGDTYVAYLFATCAGVSKVGSYAGTGATQTINCGFGAGGARFVLIKRTDSTGGWYVWDSARGMISGTDPSLLLNSTAAEVNANSVYAISTGFQIVSTAAGINSSASGATYIFLAIA